MTSSPSYSNWPPVITAVWFRGRRTGMKPRKRESKPGIGQETPFTLQPCLGYCNDMRHGERLSGARGSFCCNQSGPGESLAILLLVWANI